jgi:hypothetical protein
MTIFVTNLSIKQNGNLSHLSAKCPKHNKQTIQSGNPRSIYFLANRSGFPFSGIIKNSNCHPTFPKNIQQNIRIHHINTIEMKKLNNYFPDLAATLFIFLFAYAALSKILDYQKFSVQLGQSPLLTKFSTTATWVVPLTEAAIIALLSFKKTRLMGLYSSFTLMVMFTAYIIVITQFSDYVPCSCGGILQNMSWNEHLVFNLGFTTLGAVAVLIQNSLTKAI